MGGPFGIILRGVAKSLERTRSREKGVNCLVEGG